MRNHVAVIADDKIIIVDGIGLSFDFSCPANLHALQWRDGVGHTEWKDKNNETLAAKDYPTIIKPYVDLWETEKARLDEIANRPLTPEEKIAAEVAEARGMASAVLNAKMEKQLAQTETFSAAEFTVFAKAGLFPKWTAGESYAKSNRIAHSGIVYEVQQAVTAQGHQAPDSAGMLAIYRPISAAGDTADGSRGNPYAYLNGMDVSTGKYYSFEGKLYLAKSDMKPCVWNPGTPGLWQWELVS